MELSLDQIEALDMAGHYTDYLNEKDRTFIIETNDRRQMFRHRYTALSREQDKYLSGIKKKILRKGFFTRAGGNSRRLEARTR